MTETTKKNNRKQQLLEEIDMIIEKLSCLYSHLNNMHRDEYKCEHFSEWDENYHKTRGDIYYFMDKLEHNINEYLGTEEHKILFIKWTDKSSVEIKDDGYYNAIHIKICYFEKQEYYCLKTLFKNHLDLREHFWRDNTWVIM